MNACPTCGQCIPEHGEVRFDDDRRLVTGSGKTAYLTPNEYAIVKKLLRRWPDYVSRDALMDDLYLLKNDDPPFDRVIDVYVCKIRKKLVGLGVGISNDMGVGWRLVYDTAQEKAA